MRSCKLKTIDITKEYYLMLIKAYVVGSISHNRQMTFLFLIIREYFKVITHQILSEGNFFILVKQVIVVTFESSFEIGAIKA
ncbi:MAG: hypothetical protein JO327_07005 [Nitrososphaeraceae archaeon]|nr:hypothetical protein [Nitrososphaeraceae archaeon]